VAASSKGLYIERNVTYLFDPTEPKKFTNYWVEIKDLDDRMIGVIGIQFD